jgi:glycerophosphoryl diester phosphodiesterase
MRGRSFLIQGHRGARGLRPENTLPGFEAALDCQVDSVEVDLHLTGDGEVVICHDAELAPALFVPLDASVSPPDPRRLLSAMSLAQLRGYLAVRNPDPDRFPDQSNPVTLLSQQFAAGRNMDPYAVPTLTDLFDFAASYAGGMGEQAGKSSSQMEAARHLGFDLELKRVPFHPETMNDGYNGQDPGLLEQRIVAAARAADVVERVTVRSFDHRCVRMLRQLEPRFTGAVLVANTAPVAPVELVQRAEAQVYCPAFRFLDESQVAALHAAGIRVLPWTVNDPGDWRRLLAWCVDGLTTDYPDRLARWWATEGTNPKRNEAAC